MTPTTDGPARPTSASSPTPVIGDGLAKLPLVSLVVINWNYGEYIGAALESLEKQDYPEIEIVVVDNGSTDQSQAVIAAHIQSNPGSRSVFLPSNIGQLGAFVEVLPSLSGQFVTIVDADDILNPHFVSTHVQVHLALRHNVALTSSNLVEIDHEGRAMTGHYETFNNVTRPSGMGLRRIDQALRLPTVDDSAYQDLTRSVFSYQPGGGWIWGPGSSNMYRRAVVELVRHKPPDGTWLRAADSFLNPFCHVLGGSALIDQALSSYRVHGANYFSERETVVGIMNGNAKRIDEFVANDVETLDIFLQKTAMLKPIVGGRFWHVFDQLCTNLREPANRVTLIPEVMAVLNDHYHSLCLLFGEEVLQNELQSRLTPEDYHHLLFRGQGWLPPGGLESNAPPPIPQPTPKIVVAQAPSMRPPATAAKATPSPHVDPSSPSTDESTAKPTAYGERIGFGTSKALTLDPPIFLSGIAYEDFCGIARTFGDRYGNIPAGFLLYPTHTIASEDRAASVIAAARLHQSTYPSHQLIFLCSDAEERDRLRASGIAAFLLNINFMVSEKTFHPIENSTVEFDAIYNARFDPVKRHYLAGDLDRLAYLSYTTEGPGEQARAEQLQILLDLVLQHPTHVLLNPTDNGLPIMVSPEEVNAALNRAAVGLILSKVEGSNLASTEYLLAGLPIVSTPSVGGREVYFDHEFCTICDPDPVAVRRAVESLAARRIPRAYIRDRTLAKLAQPRQQFLDLVNQLSVQLGGQPVYRDSVWPFANLGDVVSWNEYATHLDQFENLRRSPSVGDQPWKVGDATTPDLESARGWWARKRVGRVP